MKTKFRSAMQCSILVCITLCLTLSTSAQTAWFVSTNGVGNGTSWALATKNLQGAIDLAAAGDTVWVSNGVYAAGGRRAGGTLITNRIVIDKAITVRSASNDPEQAVILGAPSTSVIDHADAIRCVWLTSNAKLVGFSLMNGGTMTNKHVNAADSRGGGAYCLSASAVLSNCVIQGNAAYDAGGGVFSGTLYDCVVMQNTARSGGGGSGSTFYNSTIISNVANTTGGGANGGTLANCKLLDNAVRNTPTGFVAYGGATYYSTVTDCLVAGNSALFGGGCYGGTLTRCVIRENVGTYGGGARAATLYNCLLYDNDGYEGGGAHSCTLYNCTIANNKGHGVYGGTLYNSISWSNTKADTATYYNSCGASFTQPGSTTSNPLFYNPSAGDYRLRPGSPCIDTGSNESWMSSATDLAGKARILPVGGTVDMGAYEYDASIPLQMAWFVTTNGTGDGSSWALATNSLQGAVDVALEGGTVWVSNGVYATGGRNNYPAGTLLTNRLVIPCALTVRSASPDPRQTVIMGAHSANGLTNGPGAVRCVYMADGAVLMGFTLTNGATLAAGNAFDQGGGGVLCQSTSAVLTNCIIAGNAAYLSGGGAQGAMLQNCTVVGNYAARGGGGIYNGNSVNCTLSENTAIKEGGGVFGGYHSGGLFTYNKALNSSAGSDASGGGARAATLSNCTFIGNSSAMFGGATYSCTLTDCSVVSNSALLAGGVYLGVASNCTLMGNSGTYGAGARAATLYNCLLYRNHGYQGAGAYDCTLYNCTIADNGGHGAFGGTMYNTISWGNSAADSDPTYYYSCGEGYSGNNSTSADPRFVDAANGNYRLMGSSPCIDTGLNQAWMSNALDLDGERRIFSRTGIVDMGAYEYVPYSTVIVLY